MNDHMFVLTYTHTYPRTTYCLYIHHTKKKKEQRKTLSMCYITRIMFDVPNRTMCLHFLTSNLLYHQRKFTCHNNYVWLCLNRYKCQLTCN